MKTANEEHAVDCIWKSSHYTWAILCHEMEAKTDANAVGGFIIGTGKQIQNRVYKQGYPLKNKQWSSQSTNINTWAKSKITDKRQDKSKRE